jgi:hypothetical protein
MVWQWHLDIQADRLKLPVRLVENSINGHDLALTGEGQLGDSLSRFITAQGLEMRPSSSAFARLKRECQILHHERTGGYYGEIDARREATVRILDAIETLEIDPQQIAAFIEGKPVNLRPGKLGYGHIHGQTSSPIGFGRQGRRRRPNIVGRKSSTR